MAVTSRIVGVGLVISRSLVQFPAGALWSVLGQDSLSHIASVYLAEKWVPSINKAVLIACALYAANCSGISLGGLTYREALPGKTVSSGFALFGAFLWVIILGNNNGRIILVVNKQN